MRFKLFLSVVLLCVLFTKAYSQELEGKLGFHGFVDNREYSKSNMLSPTYFGLRLAPEVGIFADSTHRVRIGVNMLKEFGSPDFTNDVQLTAYYQYVKNNWDFYMGLFPREGLISDYPRAILSDTLNYYRPNQQGMLAKYETKNWRQVIWIDWTSRQTRTARENFIFGFSGKYQKDMFFVSHYAMMLHNANNANPGPNDHIQDNGAAMVKIGLDLSKKTVLDSLTMNVGGMMSFERTRTIGSWRMPKGLLLEMHAEYRRFGITNSYYKGQGHELIQGDRFYQFKHYNRTDLSWRPIVYKNLEAKLMLSLHFVDGTVDNQESFGLRYNMFTSKSLKKRNNK